MAKGPAISVNKLAEYMVSKALRQRNILHDRKYPDEEFSKGMYHKECAEAVSQYISNGCIDQSPIDKAILILKQQNPEKIGTARRINANIDALESFQEMLDDIDLYGGEPSLGGNNCHPLLIHGVEVSIRPEIILRGSGKKSKKYVGAIKLHFSKTFPLNTDAAGYISALLQEYCEIDLKQNDEVVNPEYCFVIDIGSKTVFKGVKSIAARKKDIEAECKNISGLWPSI